jgi:hypothetical protein
MLRDGLQRKGIRPSDRCKLSAERVSFEPPGCSLKGQLQAAHSWAIWT